MSSAALSCVTLMRLASSTANNWSPASKRPSSSAAPPGTTDLTYMPEFIWLVPLAATILKPRPLFFLLNFNLTTVGPNSCCCDWLVKSMVSSGFETGVVTAAATTGNGVVGICGCCCCLLMPFWSGVWIAGLVNGWDIIVVILFILELVFVAELLVLLPLKVGCCKFGCCCSLIINFFQLPGPWVFCHSQHWPEFCKISRKSKRQAGRPLIMSHEWPSSGNKNGNCKSTSSCSCKLRPSCLTTSSAVFCAIAIRLLHSWDDNVGSFMPIT